MHPQRHQTGATITPNHMAHDNTNTTLYSPHSRPHHTTHTPPTVHPEYPSRETGSKHPTKMCPAAARSLSR